MNKAAAGGSLVAVFSAFGIVGYKAYKAGKHRNAVFKLRKRLNIMINSDKKREQDIDILAKTIYGEAANQEHDGKVAVANVVINRYNSHRWFTADSVAGVCLKKWQFSCWNDVNAGGVGGIADLKQGSNSSFDECVEIAELAIDGKLNDVTDNATHYHTKDFKPSMRVFPAWAKGKGNNVSARIEDHIFYKNIA